MSDHMYGLKLQTAAAALLGCLPVGQTMYLLLVHQVGLQHTSQQFAIFIMATWLLPFGVLFAFRRSSLRLSGIDLAVGLLAALMIVNLAFRTIDVTRRDLLLFGLFVLGPYAAARLMSRDLLPAFLLGLFLACAAAALYAFIFLATLLDTLETVIRPRLLGVDHGVHLIGLALAFLICFVTGRIGAPCPRRKQAALYATASISMATLVLISSRGMAAAAFLTVLVSLLVLPKAGLTQRLTQLLFMTVAAYLALRVSPSTLEFLYRMQPSSTDGFSSVSCAALSGLINSSDIRMALYSKAIDLFMAHPLFGVGLHNFAENFCPTTFPHSTLLQIASELGLAGLILTGFLLYHLLPGMISAGRTSDENDSTHGLILMVLLICSLMVDQLYGNLNSMASSMALLGAMASWLGTPASAKTPSALPQGKRSK